MKAILMERKYTYLLSSLCLIAVVTGLSAIATNQASLRFSLATATFLSVVAIALVFKFKEACTALVMAYTKDKRIFSELFDKAKLGWAIFDMNGKMLQSGKHLKETIKSISSEKDIEINSWATVVEILKIPVIYDLSSFKDGTHEIPITINRENMLPEDVTLRITKCDSTKKIVLVLHKEPNTPPVTLPIIQEAHQLTVMPKEGANLGALIEDALENLSSFIQANNLIVNIHTEGEFLAQCNPEDFKLSISKLIRDVGNYIRTTGGKKKLDILVFAEKSKSSVSFFLYNNPLTQELIEKNIGTNDEVWTLEDSLSRFEEEFADNKLKFSLKNNFDKNKNFVFVNLNINI